MQLNSSQRLALIVLGAVILIAVLFQFSRKILATRGEDIVFRDSTDSSEQTMPDASGPMTVGTIYVHVAGAVCKPGVYPFKSGTRIFQAIKAAGGTTDAADLGSFNLAAPVEDGAKLYIPAKGEDYSTSGVSDNYAGQTNAMAAASGQTFSSRSNSSSGRTTSNKFKSPGEGSVDINSAGATELTRLPGVGPSTASAIIEYRTSIGRFVSPQQLMDVKGIGPKKFAKMQPFIVCR